MTDHIRQCTFSARLDCHYLLHVPETADPRTVLVMTLHGFGQNPESMLRLTRKDVRTATGPRFPPGPEINGVNGSIENWRER